MKIIDRFIGKRAAPETRKPTDNPMKSISSMLSHLIGRKKSNSYKKSIESIKALENDRVFQCVDKIAKAVASSDWYAEIDPDAPEKVRKNITDDILSGYNRLLKNPCNLTGAQLRYWIALKLALEAKAAFKIGIYNYEPNAIYPLPGRVQAKTDNYGNITEYECGTPPTTQKLSARNKAKDNQGRITKSFCFEIFNPEITLTAGASNDPLDALAMPIEITKLLMDRAFDLADGTPNVKHILSTPQVISIEDKNAITEGIQTKQIGGDENDGFAFFYGLDLRHIAIDNNMADIHTKIPADDMARRIAGVFGVPVALLNLAGADGSKFANNYIESRQSFFEDTIIPGYLVPIQEALTNNICIEGVRIRFDLDTIPALREKRLSSFAKVKDANFLTDAEKRELLGFPPEKPAEKSGKNEASNAAL